MNSYQLTKVAKLKDNPVVAASFGYWDKEPPDNLWAIKATVKLDKYKESLTVVMVVDEEGLLIDSTAMQIFLYTQAEEYGRRHPPVK